MAKCFMPVTTCKKTDTISVGEFCVQFSIVECVMSALIDEFRHKMGSKRNVIYFRLAIVATAFLLGLPMVCSVSDKQIEGFRPEWYVLTI